MPIVPGDPFVPSVMPQGQTIYNTIDRATPDAFGGQVGQTLQQAGDALQQNALRRQQLANETAVQEAYANQFSPQLRAITQNYMKLEGKDAEAAFPQYQQEINDLRNQTRENLNPYQQRLFDERSTRRVEGDLDGMARYAASQTKQWEWNTHNAVLSDLIAEAEANYNDPRRVAAAVNQLDNQTANYANSHGWSDEVYEYQLRKNNDMLWSAVIKRRAIFDPEGAMATYRDAAAKKRISGSAQGELEQFLKPIQDLQSAQNAYGKVTGGAMARAIAGEAQRQGVDPGTALTIWSAEGGVTNPATKNPDSSATGIFQHTSGTWSDLGGTDQDRLDASRQVQLGVALARQNTAALAKDLHRQPQPWEVYLAHQQGMDGAKALLHADPDANAAEVVGNLKAITLNGGTPDMSAGQFTNYIKGYVDRHSMMYAANGVPTAQNLKENYETGLQAVTDLARQEHLGDPTAEGRYRSHYIQQMGQQLHAENMTSQANWNILNAALNGAKAIKSEQDLLTNPHLVDAYNAILKTDPSAYRVVNNAINANALAMWDPPATAQTDQLYDNLNGMKYTDRNRFSNLNLMSYHGGIPVGQLNNLISSQDKIRDNDATEATKHTSLQSSISAVNDLTSLAGASAESPFYKMDPASPFPPEQQEWNRFVSKFGQALDDWQQNNNGKIPTDIQEREIARGILFPNGMPGRLTSTEIHDLTNKQRLDPVQRKTLRVDFSDIPDAESPAATSTDQFPTDQPAAQSEEPGLQGPTLLPHSLSPQAIKALRDEHKNFLQKLGVLLPTIPGEREAVLRAPTQAEDISMTAKEKGESTIGAAPVQQSVLEAYDSFRKRILPELAPWEIEPTELFDYFSTRTAPAKSKEDWFERVLPSSLVKAAGAISGITTAYAIGTRMAETGLERAKGNLSLTEATLEDLKAVGETFPGMVKGAVKGVPGLNKDWQQEWATDPVGTAVGLLALLGIGKGLNEGSLYLSRKANVTEFLTKEGIPAEQVADTFKAIEKAQGLTQQVPPSIQENRSGVIEGGGRGEPSTM